MNVSLTERCYLLLGREAPVASDLRFVVSVLRVVSRARADRRPGAAGRQARARSTSCSPRSEVLFDILVTVADEAVEIYRTALRAWSAQDLRLATELATQNRNLDLYYERLMGELQAARRARRRARSRWPRSPPAGRSSASPTTARSSGRACATCITGEPAHLAAEVR